MKQQKTTKAISEMLNDIDNDILEQMRNVRSEQDMLYNKQYNAIARMCDEMQECFLYVNFKKIIEFADEGYITGLIEKYVFTDNDKVGQALSRQIVKKVGKYFNIYFAKFPDGCKDMNDFINRYPNQRPKVLKLNRKFL